MMSCHNGNGYAGGLPRLDVVKMGDFQVAMGGGVWVAVGETQGLGHFTVTLPGIAQVLIRNAHCRLMLPGNPLRYSTVVAPLFSALPGKPPQQLVQRLTLSLEGDDLRFHLPAFFLQR
ncbi:MAG: hypothetical protein ACYC9L_08495 [Sulfuricaulis sp.]